MISPLPKKISPDIINEFTFGEVEPQEDMLLLPCFCKTQPIKHFLGSNKSILLGGKGTGKTALFTLLKRNEQKFDNPKKAKQRVISIDSDIEYSRLKYTALDVIKSDIPDQDVQFRYLWEIYVLYRIVVELKQNSYFKDKRERKDIGKFLDIFDTTSKNPSLLEFLSSVKKSAGMKIDMTNPAFPAPDFYVAMEPSESSNVDVEELDVSLSDIKVIVNKCLRGKKEYLYLIVDNIDDFVAREDYEIQKVLLQGLIQCTRSYSQHKQIKMKLFLRTELFNSINFSQVGGYDKVSSTTERLLWKERDIWHFIAERVLWNLKSSLDVDEFEYQSHGKELRLEPWEKQKNSLFHSLLIKLGLKNLSPRDVRDSRDINLLDEAYQSAITSIFPKDVRHHNASGNVEDIDLFEFLDTHFRLGNGELTPRMYIMYIQKVFELCADYYKNNAEQEILKDIDGEFPLIKRKQMIAAYGWLQDEMLKTFLSAVTNDEWREWLQIFFRKKNRKMNFSYQAYRKVIGVPDQVEIREHLAFLCHLGVLSCRDGAVELKKRHYELPILLGKNYAIELLKKS